MKKEDLRKAFIEAAKPKPFAYNVDAWDGLKVHLLPMDRDGLVEVSEVLLDEDVRPIDVVTAVAVEHIVDESGEQLFDYDDDEDRALLYSMDVAGFRDVFAAIQDRAMGKSEKMEGNLRDGKARQRKRRR